MNRVADGRCWSNTPNAPVSNVSVSGCSVLASKLTVHSYGSGLRVSHPKTQLHEAQGVSRSVETFSTRAPLMVIESASAVVATVGITLLSS